MIKIITAIGLSSTGIVAAGVVGEFIEEGALLGKLGLVAFMGVCIVTLVMAILALCRFIVKAMMPLRDTLVKVNEALDTVHVELKEFNKK